MTAARSEGALDLSSRPLSPSLAYQPDQEIRCRSMAPPNLADDNTMQSPLKKRPYPGNIVLKEDHNLSPPASPQPSPGSLSSTPKSSPPSSASPEYGGLEPTSPNSTLDGEGVGGEIGGESGLSPNKHRPFKMYSMESMPNFYTQLAAAAASTGVYTYGTAPPSPSSLGLFDSPISLSSPIGHYLQQKKRRLESKHNQLYNRCAQQEGLLHQQGQETPSSPGSLPSSGTSGDVERYHIQSSDSRSGCSDSDSSLLLTALGNKKVRPVPENRKDDAYWERRRKNNEAAKRSRDARRAKEEEIALRAAFLEQENLKLRAQVAVLKNETAKLHYMLYNRM